MRGPALVIVVGAGRQSGSEWKAKGCGGRATVAKTFKPSAPSTPFSDRLYTVLMAIVERTRLGCPLCGLTHAPRRLGLTDDGAYDPGIHPPLLKAYTYRYGGPRHLAVEHHPLSLPFALGLRDALRTALAQLEHEIVEAGGELPE